MWTLSGSLSLTESLTVLWSYLSGLCRKLLAIIAARSSHWWSSHRAHMLLCVTAAQPQASRPGGLPQSPRMVTKRNRALLQCSRELCAKVWLFHPLCLWKTVMCQKSRERWKLLVNGLRIETLLGARGGRAFCQVWFRWVGPTSWGHAEVNSGRDSVLQKVIQSRRLIQLLRLALRRTTACSHEHQPRQLNLAAVHTDRALGDVLASLLWEMWRFPNPTACDGFSVCAGLACWTSSAPFHLSFSQSKDLNPLSHSGSIFQLGKLV